jgi:hypothetical protein
MVDGFRFAIAIPDRQVSTSYTARGFALQTNERTATEVPYNTQLALDDGKRAIAIAHSVTEPYVHRKQRSADGKRDLVAINGKCSAFVAVTAAGKLAEESVGQGFGGIGIGTLGGGGVITAKEGAIVYWDTGAVAGRAVYATTVTDETAATRAGRRCFRTDLRPGGSEERRDANVYSLGPGGLVVCFAKADLREVKGLGAGVVGSGEIRGTLKGAHGDGRGRVGGEHKIGSMKDGIGRVVTSHAAEIHACYEKRLAAKPDLAGKVEVRFHIDDQGSVASVDIVAGLDVEVDACVARIAKAMKFASGPVTVSYPLVFQRH